MRVPRGWLGLGAAALAAACASPQPQPPAGDTAAVAVAQPQAPAQARQDTQRVGASAAPPRDTVRRPPPEPMDRRPWVPRTDTLRLSVDTARAQGRTARAGEWTAGVVEARRSPDRAPVLRAVRAARNAGFDRVVFEFAGGVLPGYHVEYVDRPVVQCGSGDPTPVAGQGWLEVRMTPAQAHTDAGQATIGWRDRRFSLPVLRELEQTCDFEADVTWVLGVASPNRFRVTELSGPARLVVDVRH